RQQIVEIVGVAAVELADRFHLLRLSELLLRSLERSLSLPSLGHVAGDVHETRERADLVAHGLDHRARPEQALVPPHAPALDGAFALVAGELERARGLSALLLLLGVESTEVLSDNLRRAVLVDALPAHIPIGDVTAAVEHEDRVIGDALNHRAKTPFAFHERLLRLAALGDVVFERGFGPLALLDLGVQDLGRVLEGGAAFLERLLQFIMRALELFFGAAALGDVLRHHHEMPGDAARIGDGRNVVAGPTARAVRQHMPCFEDKSFAGVDRLPDHIAQLRQVSGVDQILDAHLQQLQRRAAEDPAKSMIGQSKASCRIDLRDAYDRLSEHRAENLLVAAEFDLHALSSMDVPAYDQTHHRAANHEQDEREESAVGGRRREWAAARQRSPDRKAGENEHAGRGIALSAAKRRPQQWQRR